MIYKYQWYIRLTISVNFNDIEISSNFSMVFSYSWLLWRIPYPPLPFQSVIVLGKSSTNILFDPKNEEEIVEIKLQPAFFADNFILPKTLNQPRTYVVTKKDFSSYQLNGKTEMIRMSERAYEIGLIYHYKAIFYSLVSQNVDQEIKTHTRRHPKRCC